MGRVNAVFVWLVTVPLLCAGGGLGALEEKSVILGGAAGWGQVTEKNGVIERSGLRPRPVLALSSKRGESVNADGAPGFWSEESDYAGAAGLTDLALSFDEADPRYFTDKTGNYTVGVAEGVLSAKGGWARHGGGAAFFPGADSGGLHIRARNGGALFSEGRVLEDFSIEFWAFPFTLERGEQLVSWNAVRPDGPQSLSCAANRNRLGWDFSGFFTAPDGAARPLFLSSKTPVLPKTWSHHLVRFNAGTGLVEYRVNGVVEDTAYATRTGKEGGEVCPPRAGARGGLTLGARFNGIIDEFLIKEGAREAAARPRYAPSGGSFRATAYIADWESDILRINALGGSAGREPGAAGGGKESRRERAGAGGFRFSGNAEIQFFMRAAAKPELLEAAPWTAFTPASPLGARRGRYVEIKADLYPSGDSEVTPYLESLEIVYIPSRAPPPPEYVSAVARDGAVELRWKGSAASNGGGYLVYYGARSGEYLGRKTFEDESPIDAGERTNLRIDNLNNGTVYYFAVSTYDKTGPARAGEFSKEVSARPLKENRAEGGSDLRGD